MLEGFPSATPSDRTAPLYAYLIIGALTVFGCTADTPSPDATDRPDASPPDPVPYRAGTDHLQIRRDDSYESLFVKGINLGVGVPGTLAGELAATRDQYRRWLNRIRTAGFNTIRIYTLHYPRFYEVLREHNRRHPDDPLYLLHGVWVPEQSETRPLFELTERFDANIREAVDCVHGNCRIEQRRGRAHGTYEADVSRWTLGYVIGREFSPGEIEATDDARPALSSFDGSYFRVESGDAVEVWLARRLDALVDYERTHYGVERPVSVASWPTLDPLDHPTEHPRYSREDIADIDLSVVSPTGSKAGLFASYHAYPYYPNFMREQPGYREFADDAGPNAYLGYLFDLNDHYDEMPLLIAEFGVPSSWVNAHSGYTGMNHGHHTEREQGRAGARMFRNLFEATTAGGALFAWLDEWWKPTWLTNPRDFPFDRRRLWHNVAAPEQNFGMIGFDLGAPDFGTGNGVAGTGPISRLEVATDAAYLHLRLGTRTPLGPDDLLVVGFDTYGDALGESILPDGTRVSRRSEYALIVRGRSAAELKVIDEYRMTGIWRNGGEARRDYQSVRSEDGKWSRVRFQKSQPHGTPDGEYWFEPTYHDAGDLRVRSADEQSTNLDSVVVSDDRIRVRLPWTYLGVTDPSRRRVMHDAAETPDRETRRTDGIAVSVVYNGRLLFETRRFGWETWEKAPETTERVKRSLPIISEALQSLPDRIE